MKKLILTSNKYSFCIEAHQKLIDRHWKGDDNEYTLLGFDKPKVELNKNIKFECLGAGLNDATPWTEALTPFITNLEEDYFLLVFEDHFLVNDTNIDLLKEAEEIMKTDKSVGKVRTAPAYQNLDIPRNIPYPSYNEKFYKGTTTPHSYLPTSLRPSIWRKELFLNLLHNPAGVKTPQEFEIFNDRLHIDTTVLVPKGESSIYPEIDAMRFGKPNPIVDKANSKIDMGYYWISLSEEDVEIFAENKIKWLLHMI